MSSNQSIRPWRSFFDEVINQAAQVAVRGPTFRHGRMSLRGELLDPAPRGVPCPSGLHELGNRSCHCLGRDQLVLVGPPRSAATSAFQKNCMSVMTASGERSRMRASCPGRIRFSSRAAVSMRQASAAATVERFSTPGGRPTTAGNAYVATSTAAPG
ncbi:hypothetical protein C2845_PM05G33250 [Panicum miliaceum]|uniref:Uncharacterized protein n=1 Tax=Panicum miliaceum TaxID=4540 RepID=A0A3L6T2S9_PANMI|nr:hypothetical protein C2845_PM05G33250 [Panicum miliaceum]